MLRQAKEFKFDAIIKFKKKWGFSYTANFLYA